MEGLVTPDGKPVDVDAAEQIERDFARAQSTAPTDTPSPPKKPATDGTEPAKPKRGRPPKSEQPRVTAAPPAASAPALDKQRLEGVKGFAQIGAGLCLMLDARTPDADVSWRADAVTLANAAEPLAAACVEVAKQNSGFAAALDKVTKVGPYGALISVGLGLAGQLARNHGIKAGEMLGAVSPEALLASLEDEPKAA
jgi:hypothetical protein